MFSRKAGRHARRTLRTGPEHACRVDAPCDCWHLVASPLTDSQCTVSTFIALLRGINVGTAKRVPMADLRAVLSGLGYADVATLLNSGNAVFGASQGTPAHHAAVIANALAVKFAFDVPVIVKTAREIDRIARENALASAAIDPSRLLVIFTQTRAQLTAIRPIADLVVSPERFVVGRHAGYLTCPEGISKSRAATVLLGKSGAGVTTRNWATVLKLLAVAGARGLVLAAHAK